MALQYAFVFCFLLAGACADQSIEWDISPSPRDLNVSTGEKVTFIFGSDHDLFLMESEKASDLCIFDDATQLSEGGNFTYTVPSNMTVGQKLFFSCQELGHCTIGQRLTLTVTEIGPTQPPEDNSATQLVCNLVLLTVWAILVLM